MESKEHNLQDKRCECCGYMTYHSEHIGCIRAAEQAQQAEPVGYVAPDELPALKKGVCAFLYLQPDRHATQPVYAQPPAVAVAALLNDLAAYAPLSGSLCAPTALQGLAIRAANMLAAMEQPK